MFTQTSVITTIGGEALPQSTWKPLKKKQDGAHKPECKHDRKATYVQMTLL